MTVNPADFAEQVKAEKELWWHQGMRRILFRLLDPLVAGRSIRAALDVGWGTGYFAQTLQARYDWRVYPLALGCEREPGVERLSRATLDALPFPDSSFDAVFSMDVLGHVPQGREQRPIAELARVLAPNGLLVLRTGAFEMFRGRRSDPVSGQQRFTRRRMIELIEPHGIRVLRSSYLNALLAPAALARLPLGEPCLSKPSANVKQAPRWLNRLLYAPLAAESVWLGAGLNFPLGQTLLLIGEKSG